MFVEENWRRFMSALHYCRKLNTKLYVKSLFIIIFSIPTCLSYFIHVPIILSFINEDSLNLQSSDSQIIKEETNNR